MEGLAEKNEGNPEKDKFSKLLSIVKAIEEISNQDNISPEEFEKQSKDLVEQLLSHLDSDLHMELSSDVTAIYSEMSNENLLARVEKIVNVVKCLAEGSPIIVGKNDHHHANSVTADPIGLRIAMAEADAIGPLRLLVGLDVKSLVGFKHDHVSVTEIDHDEFDVRDTMLREALCRHIKGEIHREDIRYVIIRIPRHLFPKEMLLKDETETRSQFIFRGAKIPNVAFEIEEERKEAA